MKIAFVLVLIGLASLAGFFLLDYLGYNPIREYRIGAELNRLHTRDINIDCEKSNCTVKVEEHGSHFTFNFSQLDELKTKVSKVMAMAKNWPTAKSECVSVHESEGYEWCEV